MGGFWPVAGLASLVKFTVCGPGKFLLLPKLGASANKTYHFKRTYKAYRVYRSLGTTRSGNGLIRLSSGSQCLLDQAGAWRTW